MEINITYDNSRVPVTIFHITGDIDAATHEQLGNAARQAIDSGTRCLLLDLKDVPYVSSYGVRTLTDIFNWLRDCDAGEDDAALSKGLREGNFRSHRLKLANLNPQVARTLKTMGVDMYIDILPDTRQALAAF